MLITIIWPLPLWNPIIYRKRKEQLHGCTSVSSSLSPLTAFFLTVVTKRFSLDSPEECSQIEHSLSLHNNILSPATSDLNTLPTF